jgi:hypothetical protein
VGVGLERKYGLKDSKRGAKLGVEVKCNWRRKVIIIFLYGLGRLTFSGIDPLPSFPRASTIVNSSRFVVEGAFRKSGVVQSFKMDDPVLLTWICLTRGWYALHRSHHTL